MKTKNGHVRVQSILSSLSFSLLLLFTPLLALVEEAKCLCPFAMLLFGEEHEALDVIYIKEKGVEYSDRSMKQIRIMTCCVVY